MTLTPPPARALPDPDRVLSRVLADSADHTGTGSGHRSPPARSRWTVALGSLAAAGVVGATVLGASVLRPVDTGTLPPSAGSASTLPAARATAPAPASTPTTPTTLTTPTGPDSEALVTGPLTAAEARSITAACTHRLDAPARSTAHQRYVEVGGAFPTRLLTVVVTAADGTVWACSAPEEEPQSVTGGDITGQTKPGRGSWVLLGSASTMRGAADAVDLIEASGWAVLPKGAAAARVRWLVNGVAHPWRTAVPVDGLAFLVVHLDAPVSVGDVLVAQAQVLDGSGRVLEDTRQVRSEVVQHEGHVTLEGVR